MIAAIVILALTCISIILSVVLKPNVKIGKFVFGTYWMVALIGAILMIVFNVVSLDYVVSGLTQDTSVNPIKILILFLSVTLLSVYLDEFGFFSYLAERILSKTSSNQKTFFISLYIIVSVLTVFTSNDIVVLTFTPFILYFCKNAKINPVPFLFTEFVAANTWSMVLIIGNPTNIYLATSQNIDFFKYFITMLLPTIASGVLSFIILYLLFRKELNKKIENNLLHEDYVKIKDKFLLAVGICFLTICIILLAISSYIGLEMWIICLSLFVLEVIITIVYYIVKGKKPTALLNILKRAPYSLIPFVISMFVVVLGVNNSGLSSKISSLLAFGNPIITYGLTSYLTANIINNIPMSVLFSSLITEASGIGSVYASIIGSNLGALLSPIGALAGIMWCSLLRLNNVDFSFGKFLKYGCIVSIPSIIVALLVLMLVV